MKVLKFGGTSVGSAQRMKEVAKLITDGERKIVVLSAMSGTTNTLVEISDYLYKKNPEGANEIINKLEAKYKQHVDELYATEEYKQKGLEVIKSHFDYIRSYTKDLFTLFEEKVVLAQGELISTAMVNYYLQECGVKSVLLPALEYMRTDKNAEPDPVYIKDKLQAQLISIRMLKFISLRDSSAAMLMARLITCSVAEATIPLHWSVLPFTLPKFRSGRISTVCTIMTRALSTKRPRCVSCTLKRLPSWLISVPRFYTRLVSSRLSMPTYRFAC